LKQAKRISIIVLSFASCVENTERLAVPANLRLHLLLACTPELQPIEALWPLMREALANDMFRRIGQLRWRIRRRDQ
jgi:hypothetical protein